MLRWLTAGESHGPELVAILEGMPAGVPVSPEQIQEDLERRMLRDLGIELTGRSEA